MEKDSVKTFEKVKEQVRSTQDGLSELVNILEGSRRTLEDRLLELQKAAQTTQYEFPKLKDFLDEPYCILPKRADEWWVIVPKFVNFQLGWLERSTHSFNIFLVNKYMTWLAEIPEELKGRFKFRPPLPVKVYDGVILTGPEHQDSVWARYRRHLLQRLGNDRIRIKSGHEFSVIASMIEDGTLPFMPRPVEEEDLRPYDGIELRDYQEKAWEEFLQYGALGIFWAFGAGKTFLGLYAMGRLRGNHLVIVPTRTLKEQWISRIQRYGIENVRVETYHAFKNVCNEKFTLTCYDECHRLPANTFSRMATLRTKYRIGLSGTPIREDKRTNYIFALTGKPHGMDWTSLIKLGIITMPTVTVYVFPSLGGKMEKLDELLKDEKKTLIFCDSLKLGERISKKYGIPFVYGDTRKRLQILEKATTSVISRVGDEGISMPTLQRVIEIDFLYGSRRQEAQRVGRLFHSIGEGEHYVLMTDEELELYEKRLYSLFEKGIRVSIIR